MIVRHFDRALFVTFDYGHEEKALFSGRARRFGTAVAYAGHQATRDLLANPGGQDLTAHVNFTDLIRAGERAGCHTLALQGQAMMLLKLGAAEHRLLQMLDVDALEDAAAAMQVLAERDAAKRLVLPDGPGVDVRVLAQSRGLPLDPWSFEGSLM
jgi:SAM-dependent MidA family methyltransferase